MERKIILVVEDDESIRRTLKLALEFAGYSVKTAGNGQEALDLLKKMPNPCLILLDLKMPVMDGWTFDDILKNDPERAAIPIAVLTAYVDLAKNMVRASPVIKNPVDLDNLYRIVKDICYSKGRI